MIYYGLFHYSFSYRFKKFYLHLKLFIIIAIIFPFFLENVFSLSYVFPPPLAQILSPVFFCQREGVGPPFHPLPCGARYSRCGCGWKTRDSSSWAPMRAGTASPTRTSAPSSRFQSLHCISRPLSTPRHCIWSNNSRDAKNGVHVMLLVCLFFNFRSRSLLMIILFIKPARNCFAPILPGLL